MAEKYLFSPEGSQSVEAYLEFELAKATYELNYRKAINENRIPGNRTLDDTLNKLAKFNR